jgi:predicted SpoU family rRNA methylase
MKSSLDNDNYRWASAIKADSPDSVSIYTKDTNDCIATWLNDATLTTVADTTIASNTLYVNDGISINDYIDNKIYQALEKKNEPTENVNVNNKGDKTMNMMNFDFGAVRGDSVHLSMYGIAIKNKNGRWASYDAKSQSIMDVEVFNVGGQNYLYKMPVGVDDVKVGDVIIHSKVPMFVTAINKSEDGKVLSFKAVDPYAGEEKTVLPLKNMFNFNFVTKIVSIMDGFGGFSADEKNPFGNMLPLMVFGDNDADIDPMMLMLMMNAQGDGAGINQNLLLALALNKESGSKDNMLPMLMMMGMNKN